MNEQVWHAVLGAAMTVAAWFVGGWLRRAVVVVWGERGDATVRNFLVSAIRPAVLVVAVPPVLDTLGVSANSALAVVSAAGLAVAIGLRESLSNVASGVLLLSFRPVQVGDVVTVAGVSGTVTRIGLVLLELETDDGRRVSVTNDRVLAAPMERHAAHGQVRVEVAVRVPIEGVDRTLLDRLQRAAEAELGGPAEVSPVEADATGARILVRGMVDRSRAAVERNRLFAAVVGVAWPGGGSTNRP